MTPTPEARALQAAAEDTARAAFVFARHLQRFADTHWVPDAVLSCALAITFASLLVDLDGQPTLYEVFGLGVATDEARIDLFLEQVRAAAAEMRAGDAATIHH